MSFSEVSPSASAFEFSAFECQVAESRNLAGVPAFLLDLDLTIACVDLTKLVFTASTSKLLAITIKIKFILLFVDNGCRLQENKTNL